MPCDSKDLRAVVAIGGVVFTLLSPMHEIAAGHSSIGAFGSVAMAEVSVASRAIILHGRFTDTSHDTAPSQLI